MGVMFKAFSRTGFFAGMSGFFMGRTPQSQGNQLMGGSHMYMQNHGKIYFFFAVALIFICQIFTGCSSSSSNDTPGINLTNDADHDGLPDELESSVGEILSMTDGSVNADKADMMIDAYEKFGDRLPYSRKVRAIHQEIADLYASYEALPVDEKTEEAFLRLKEQLEINFQELSEDKTYAAIQDYMEEILKSDSGDPATEAWAGNEKWDSLRRGDVMLIKSPDLDWHQRFYVWKYSHAGVYNGNNLVYEAIGEGVALRPLSKWKKDGVYVGLGRSNVKSESEVCAKLDELYGTFGDGNTTAYNYIIPMKTSCVNMLKFKDAPRYRENALYCSQLVWWLHNYLLGYDIDSNDERYYMTLIAQVQRARYVVNVLLIPGVLPDEIALSQYIDMYAVGPNITAVVKPSAIICSSPEPLESGRKITFTAKGASSPDGREIEYNFKVETCSDGSWSIMSNNWQTGSSLYLILPEGQGIENVSISVRVREKDVQGSESGWYSHSYNVEE